MAPIQLYTYQTPNGHKASIMLEEIGLPYEVHVVDIETGDQHAPAFLALNPNNKIPVITDPDRGRTVFESGAILPYLAERSGKLLPADADERLTALQWSLFQAAHLGPALGQLWNYKLFASEKIPYVIGRFEKETARVFGVLDGVLGRRCSAACASLPWPVTPDRLARTQTSPTAPFGDAIRLSQGRMRCRLRSPGRCWCCQASPTWSGP